MGKQKKRRNNNKKSGKASKKTGVGAERQDANMNIPKSACNIVNRIRHGEIRVRHGALTALSATLFSPSSLARHSSANTNRTSDKISMEMIQAMSERIMDDDVPVAMCALGCMGNYILFRTMDNSCGTKVETMLTPILLKKMNGACDAIENIAREMTALEQTSAGIGDDSAKAEADVNMNKKKKAKKNGKANANAAMNDPMHKKTLAFMEQWAVQSLCLHALCGMVEGMTTANHESSSVLHHLKEDFVSTVLRTFLLATECITGLGIKLGEDASASGGEDGAKTQAAESTNRHNMKQWIATKENESNTIADVVTYAARTIHSSCDENPTFFSSLFNTMIGAAGAGAGWKAIVSSITNSSLPTLTRIHCSGIVILARQSVAMSSSSSFMSSPASSTTVPQSTPTLSQLTEIVVTQALPLLSTCTTYNPSIASALYNRISVTYSQLKKEKEDEAMEANVIRTVTERKESARLIARRQKLMKEERRKQKLEQQEKEMESAEGTSAMDEDNDDGQVKENDQTSPSKPSETSNDTSNNESLDMLEDQYDKAVNAWKNACLPLKLSVEVIANLCVSDTDDYGNDGDAYGEINNEDDDDMAWDSDEEERLLNEHQKGGDSSCTGRMISKEEEAFRNQVVASGVTDRVLAVFGTILLSFMTDDNDTTNSSSSTASATNTATTIHPLAMEDLMEVIGKCSICMGNAACNLPKWKCDEKDVTSMWNEFMQCLKASANRSIPTLAIASILSSMGAFLRFRPTLVKSVNEQGLDLILSFVLMEYSSSSTSSSPGLDEEAEKTAVADIQKDAIGMLGILCSEPHPDGINEKICSAFITSLQRHHSTTTAVMSEVLNALMDMYSADEGDPDNHEGVFRAKNVLGVFQKTVPIFKRKIREDEGKIRVGLVCSFEEIEVWRETALNAVRFIKYKKGH